ncbi:MAG TPA: hypothetical protein VH619_02085 [Verrucomicrobiae bacterium]|nr:hypothetical protein [Verrucomicrobiae bacterium]
MAHSFAGGDRVLQAVHANGGCSARQTNAARFFAHHMDLLPGHGGAVGLEQSGKFVANFLSAPALFFHSCVSPPIFEVGICIIHQFERTARKSVNYFGFILQKI